MTDPKQPAPELRIAENVDSSTGTLNTLFRTGTSTAWNDFANATKQAMTEFKSPVFGISGDHRTGIYFDPKERMAVAFQIFRDPHNKDGFVMGGYQAAMAEPDSKNPGSFLVHGFTGDDKIGALTKPPLEQFAKQLQQREQANLKALQAGLESYLKQNNPGAANKTAGVIEDVKKLSADSPVKSGPDEAKLREDLGAIGFDSAQIEKFLVGARALDTPSDQYKQAVAQMLTKPKFQFR